MFLLIAFVGITLLGLIILPTLFRGANTPSEDDAWRQERGAGPLGAQSHHAIYAQHQNMKRQQKAETYF